jgi:hypothetical protein
MVIANWLDPTLCEFKTNDAVNWANAFNPRISVKNALNVSVTYNNKRVVDFKTGLVQETNRYQVRIFINYFV